MNKRTRQIMLATVGLLILIALQFFFSPSRVPAAPGATSWDDGLAFARERATHDVIGRDRPER